MASAQSKPQSQRKNGTRRETVTVTIASYSRLAKVNEPKHELTNDCFDNDHIRMRENPKMPYIGTIENENCYWETDDSERYDFYAGNNPGFQEWCDILVQLVHGCVLEDYLTNKDRDPAFYELVRYDPKRENYDNWPAAVIGPQMCAKLYKDFKKYASKIEKVVKKTKEDAQPDGLWWDRYGSWMKGFELGADSGALVFE
jgi:hypothetical protein